MADSPGFDLARVIGDPTRGRMLIALMRGHALTATELALEGGVSAATASSHLARLTDSDVVIGVRSGRHRYYRLADHGVAELIEGLLSYAADHGRRRVRPGPRDEQLRRARVCYDHLAGSIGVRLLDRMRAHGVIGGPEEAPVLTPHGLAWSRGMGLDVPGLSAARRPLCRSCMDWSERRPHLGGALGAAVLELLFAKRLARRKRASRALDLTPLAEWFVERLEL